MDEQDAFEAIEAEAERWIVRGYVPTDAEPGEWLVLRHPDGPEITIVADSYGEIEVNVTTEVEPS